MTFQEPKEWLTWLHLVEWWYNTSYHTSLKITPFQALYGYHPPQIGELTVPCNISAEAQVAIEQKEEMVLKIKENLLQAQGRIKHFADKRRTERTFEVGDMVYLKMQLDRQNAFGLRGALKLRSKYYGPFRVMERIGRVAYKLQLPDDAHIHPVFHVSQLKKHVGLNAVPLPGLPLVGDDGKVKNYPVSVLERRVIPRRNEHVVQWLVQWENLDSTDATWEDAAFIQKTFPQFSPWGQG